MRLNHTMNGWEQGWWGGRGDVRATETIGVDDVRQTNSVNFKRLVTTFKEVAAAVCDLGFVYRLRNLWNSCPRGRIAHSSRRETDVERGGRLCLSVARSALSLTLQALNGTPQSEVTPHESCLSIFNCMFKCLSRIVSKTAQQISTAVGAGAHLLFSGVGFQKAPKVLMLVHYYMYHLYASYHASASVVGAVKFNDVSCLPSSETDLRQRAGRNDDCAPTGLSLSHRSGASFRPPSVNSRSSTGRQMSPLLTRPHAARRERPEVSLPAPAPRARPALTCRRVRCRTGRRRAEPPKARWRGRMRVELCARNERSTSEGRGRGTGVCRLPASGRQSKDNAISLISVMNERARGRRRRPLRAAPPAAHAQREISLTEIYEVAVDRPRPARRLLQPIPAIAAGRKTIKAFIVPAPVPTPSSPLGRYLFVPILGFP
ncbi:hypothetical protein EVAR_67009_1 [Eumeta japonica]|uniref:Uncharacterized protein n=1 Tax=Eumeta variegata TaxID=151549 RepID=A0A4C1ZRX6_EUMVA|nr:hypothetical protein EVAR_67009_1 [Eumeta japonica]